MRKIGRLKIIKINGEYQLVRENSTNSFTVLFKSRNFLLINEKFDYVKHIAI